MSATTPLMSEYPTDNKEPVQSELPVYRINEDNEELAVGGAPACKRTCFWKRFRCNRAEGQEHKKRSCARRIVRWFLALVVVLGIIGFFVHKHKLNCMMKMHPVTCVPLGEDHYSISLPLTNLRTHIGLHGSLTGGDTHVIHSDEVEEGTALISFEMPKDVEYNLEDPELFVCHVSGPKFVGLGIHPKDKHHKRVKATTTTIMLSSAETNRSRSINFLGGHPRFRFIRKLMHKKIKEAISRAFVKAAPHAE